MYLKSCVAVLFAVLLPAYGFVGQDDVQYACMDKTQISSKLLMESREDIHVISKYQPLQKYLACLLENYGIDKPVTLNKECPYLAELPKYITERQHLIDSMISACSYGDQEVRCELSWKEALCEIDYLRAQCGASV